MDVERFFQRLLQFRGIDSWCPLHDDGSGGRIDHSVQKNATVVRIQRMERVSLEQKIAMMRPEFQAIAHEHVAQPLPIWKRVLEHFAPGDAVMEWYPASGCIGASSAVQLSRFRTMGMMGGALDFSKPQLLRMTIWRDYPKKGQLSGICVHLDSEEDSVGSPAFFFGCRGLGDGSAVLTEQFMEVPWPNFPDWWTPALKHFFMAFGQFCGQLSAPEALSSAEGLYAIASLRSCPRGPPLLPFRKDERKAAEKEASVEMGGFIWVPAQHPGFNFPEYLKHLMRFVSSEPDRVFDRLDGKKLVPYQAAIFHGQSAPVELNDLFRLQQAAYRRLRGGKSAPKIYFGGRPSFLDLSCEAPHLPARVTERKTFVEWADEVPPTGHPNRSAEYP